MNPRPAHTMTESQSGASRRILHPPMRSIDTEHRRSKPFALLLVP